MFGDLLRDYRHRIGLTQDELAAKSHVSVRSIRTIESGRVGQPRPGTLRLLADALGLTGQDRDRFFGPAADQTGSGPGRPVPGGPGSGRPVPAQLPADVAGFAGRTEYLDRLTALLGGRDKARPAAVVISAIAGTAGIGKTALAVHWAHRVAHRFPDGQLYVNLRGFGPSGAATSPSAAVPAFLDALGVPPHRIPTGLEAQASLYRSLLAGRRMLVVLDNARDAEQVRPLLPGSSGCLVVVTSRNDLAGLVATEGAQPFNLDVLSTVEARQLLAHRLGNDRLAAEGEAVDDIIVACGRLPLALAIVAAKASSHPGFPLSRLAAELRGGLDALQVGDAAADLRAVFGWSYLTLTPDTARLFRLLGLHWGPDISAPAAASLAGVPVAQARPRLAELTGAHLIAEHRPGRYVFHDLVRAYTEELAQDVPERDRSAAVQRALDHYLHTGYAAELQVSGHKDPIALPLRPAAPGTIMEHLANVPEAMDWLAAEHSVLLGALRHAVDAGLDTLAWQLAWALDTILDRRGHWPSRLSAWRDAVEAADRLGELAAQALAYRRLAHTLGRLGRHADAETHLLRVLDLYAPARDSVGQAHTHRDLALVYARRGRTDQALHHAQRALALFETAGHRGGQGQALNAVGWYHGLLGDHAQALTFCGRALVLNQQLGDRTAEAHTWDSLGFAHHHLGRYGEAAACYEQALAAFHEHGDRYNEATTLTHLGDTHHAAGDADAARATWRRALDILTELYHDDADTVQARLHT